MTQKALELVTQLKHMAGKHNQKLHGRGNVVLLRRTSADVRSGAYESLYSDSNKTKVVDAVYQQVASGSASRSQARKLAKEAGYRVIKGADGNYHAINIKDGGESVERRLTTTDTHELHQTAETPAKGANVNGKYIKRDITDTIEFANYDNFAKATDKEQHIKDTIDNITDAFGYKVNISIMDDAEFENSIGKIKMTAFGALHGASAVSASYNARTNTIRLRRRDIANIRSRNDHRLTMNTVTHELGHSFHANIWNIKTVGKGPYANTWAEEFAEAFSSQFGWSDKMSRDRKNPESRWYDRAVAYDPNTAIDRIIDVNKPTK